MLQYLITSQISWVFTTNSTNGPRCGMDLSELAPDVEMAPDVGIGPRLGTNPRSESYIYIKIYANSRYKISQRKCVGCKVKHNSHYDFQKATLLFQPYSDCAQTSLNIYDLRMPYGWFNHNTTQNGLHREKRV